MAGRVACLWLLLWMSVGSYGSVISRKSRQAQSIQLTGNSTCVTMGGNNPGASCVFPFIIDGVEFNGCTNALQYALPDDGDVPWCSTLVDGDGVHDGFWGNCGEGCKMDFTGDQDTMNHNCSTMRAGRIGRKCVFPFIDEGVEYNGCNNVTDQEDGPWCSTLVDTDGVHVEGWWGHCGENCKNNIVVPDSNATQTWGEEECSQPCTGPKCGPLTDLMKFLVDFTVDPCEDFFAFACSSKTRGKKLPITRREKVDFKQLVKFPPKGFEYVQKFYLSCTKVDTGFTTEEVFAKCFEDGMCEEEEIKKYGDIFAQFLHYTKEFINKTKPPAVTPDWETVTQDLFEGQGWNWWDFAASGLKDFFFLGAFHKVSKEIDFFSSQIVFSEEFRSNMFFTPMTDTVTEYASLDVYPKIHIVPMSIHQRLRNGDEEYKTDYKNLMKRFFTAFGGDPITVAKDVEKIVEMELEVGKINSNRWLDAGAGENITITELSELVPSVEWKDYIEGAFSDNPDFKIKRDHNLIIPSKDIMRKMGELIENLPLRDQANLIIWRMFITFANDFMHTGSEVDDLQEDLFSSTSESNTRPNNCIEQINTFFPYAHDDMYIANYIDDSSKNAIREMFKSIGKDFEEIIEETDYLSRGTQNKAKQKLKAMKLIIGELSPNTLEFRELKQKMSSQDYIGNILAISNYNWDTLSKNINEEKKLQIFSVDTTNAYYAPPYNHVNILTGIVNDLVVTTGLSPGIPRALVYGGFGGVLGHEMIHGFDNNGRFFDKDGYRLNWWKPNEDEIFKEKTQCLKDMYYNFTIPYNGNEYQVTDRDYSPGDNIADNGGVKAAYRSYQKLPETEKRCMPDEDLPFTSDQLFWLGWGFTWCTFSNSHETDRDYEDLLLAGSRRDIASHFPKPWRINTVFSNQPEFATAFQCPVGSKLNPLPEERCTVW